MKVHSVVRTASFSRPDRVDLPAVWWPASVLAGLVAERHEPRRSIAPASADAVRTHAAGWRVLLRFGTAARSTDRPDSVADGFLSRQRLRLPLLLRQRPILLSVPVVLPTRPSAQIRLRPEWRGHLLPLRVPISRLARLPVQQSVPALSPPLPPVSAVTVSAVTVSAVTVPAATVLTWLFPTADQEYSAGGRSNLRRVFSAGDQGFRRRWPESRGRDLAMRDQAMRERSLRRRFVVAVVYSQRLFQTPLRVVQTCWSVRQDSQWRSRWDSSSSTEASLRSGLYFRGVKRRQESHQPPASGRRPVAVAVPLIVAPVPPDH